MENGIKLAVASSSRHADDGQVQGERADSGGFQVASCSVGTTDSATESRYRLRRRIHYILERMRVRAWVKSNEP